jgi:hypothetical protein
MQKLVATVAGVNALICWWSYRNATKTIGTRKFPMRMTVGYRLGLPVKNIIIVAMIKRHEPISSTRIQLRPLRGGFWAGNFQTF